MTKQLMHWVLVMGLMSAAVSRAAAEGVSQPIRLFGLGSLNLAILSNDGRHLATAGESAAYLWDFRAGIVRHRLPNHRTMVAAAAFSPDGTRLVMGARFGSIGIWSVESGELVRLFSGHGGDVISIACAPDGQRFVTASDDNTAAVWSLETGQLLQRVRVPGTRINGAVFTPDGRRIVTADTFPTNNVRVWDLETGSEVRQLKGHAGGTAALAFVTDDTLATGGSDQKVTLWNLATGEAVQTLEAARGAVSHLVVIPGSKLLAVGSQDRRVNVYDWSTGQAPYAWQTETLNSLGWVPGTETLISATTDLLVRVIDLKTGLTQRVLSGHTASTATDVSISPDGQYVFAAGVEKAARLWNRSSGELVRVFEGSGEGSMAAAFSPNGKRVLTTAGVPRKSAFLRSTETGQIERELAGHTDWLLAATFSPDGSRVATSSLDRTVRVWNAVTGEQVRSFGTGGNFMYSVAFTPDGKRVAGGGSSFDPTVHIWDIESGSTQATISADAGSVRSIHFPPSGDTIIIGWDEGLVRMMDLKTGQVLREFFAEGFVSDMALSPDGDLLAVGEGWPSFAARVVDLRSGETVRVLMGHTTPVGAVAFNQSGTQIVTGADIVRLWDVTDLAARLRTERKPGGLELTWRRGILEQAPAVGGPWSEVPEAQSPVLWAFDQPHRFFRTKVSAED